MKAFILCAGQGLRLGVLTENNPKCLVEYRGRPIIEYTLETLRAVGVSDITLITGYRRECLDRYGLKTVFNPEFATSNMVTSLFCAERELEGDVLISYGDIIYRPEIPRALIDARADIAITVDTRWKELWEARMEDPLRDAETMKIDANGFVTELGKKPQTLADIQAQYMGLIAISGHVLPSVKEFYHELPADRLYDGKDKKNMYMTSFLQAVINSLMPIRAVPVAGGWLEVDAPGDLDAQMIS